ncbi:MAG: hypothetical protein KCHDKBKB_01327 [Elusimicrobia bacterium]|nr:hypothetical protein [Elusimicrobiota bacterium]
MRKCRRQWTLFPLGLFVAGIFSPGRLLAELRVAPEMALYITHNSNLRSRFVANGTWKEEVEEFTSAGFEYDLDIGLLSFFRRYVFKDPNAEKSKRISVRLGYAYLPDLVSGDPDLDEERALGEVTFRFPLGQAWLLTDRNRGELRFIGDVESTRYRNRLRLERNVAISRFRITPYANAEAFFESITDEWNQVDGTVGAEFPWHYQTILEFYCTWQFTRNLEDDQIFGVTLQKHL